jgi:ABC-type antimicrobial peptide transport system permease subunit
VYDLAALSVENRILKDVAGIPIYLTTLLYGVTSHDWVTFAVAFITITLVAINACLVPAIRTARIDPLSAIRAM